jgi:ribosomal protein S18 acetylase RimI-like enzyme
LIPFAPAFITQTLSIATVLDFVPLTARNFSLFEQDILTSEEVFPEDIRETAEGYLDALRQERTLGIIARYHRLYVGNAVGFTPDVRQCEILRLDQVRTAATDLLYLFNIVTLPAYQGRGFGKELLRIFLDMANAGGFKKVGGHFRGNGSLKNFRCLGGEELGVYDDWFGTGERYTYCEIDLPITDGGQLLKHAVQAERNSLSLA